MFDQGKGPAVVVVPGVQGRWEWMKPALDELAGRCHTISYSLCGDIGSGEKADPALGFDNYLGQLDAVLDRLGPVPVALCGVSFGGFVALRYAAAPGTRHVARPRVGAGARVEAERAAGALDLAAVDVGAGVRRSPRRCDVWPEVQATFPTWSSRAGILRAPGSARGERADDPVADGGARPARAAARFRSRLRAHPRANARPYRRGAARPRRPGREHAAFLHVSFTARVRCPRAHRPPRHR